MRARRALTSPIAAAAGLAAVAALAAGAAPQAAPARPALARAAAAPAPRVTGFTLGPAPNDLALAEVRFPASARRTLSGANLRLLTTGRVGDDYLALVAVAHPGRGGARALVLIVNRPSALLDPARVALRLRSSRMLGPARLRSAVNVLARAPSAPRLALCALPLGGKPLAAGGLRAISAQGAPLSGFSAAWATAAAYDAACGLAYPASFKQAIAPAATPGGGCGAGASLQGWECCPPGATCAPLPEAPPEPKPAPQPEPPKCPPCNPKPGYACPLVANPSICPAAAAGRPAAPASH